MKSALIFFFILFAQLIQAQNFTEAPSFIPFEGVEFSSIAFADVDGDQDQDVLITGGGYDDKYSKLYLNDGMGRFTEMYGTPFEGVEFSSIAFADVDGDQDQDVLITGEASSTSISKLYINDGVGNFTEMLDTPFESIDRGSIAFADVDGDQDQDVLITGANGFVIISKLYINDGEGHFTEVMDTPFEGVNQSSIAFADVDGDQDQDVLITGLTLSFYKTSKLYTNDGEGNFTEVLDTPFESVASGSIAFADVDGDQDQDVLITGSEGDNYISKLYTNDGQGHFVEVLDTPFRGVVGGSIAFADVDGDQDQDVLITGRTNQPTISKLYTNDGEGHFTEVLLSPFEGPFINGVRYGSIAFADVDGDQDQDLLITGSSAFGIISKMHINDGEGNFTEVTGIPFKGVSFGSIAFADVNDDQDQDVLITGLSRFTLISKLYTNNGTGDFTEVLGTPFEGVLDSSIAFADVDGDQDQDVLITGRSSNDDKISKLYINDGVGRFTEMMGTPFEGVGFSSVAFADVDGDQDQDILITGANEMAPISKLYTNDGLGNFTEVLDTPFEGVQRSSIAFADVDGDQDQDVFITGTNSFGYHSKLYINDGEGHFDEMLNTPFEPLASGSIAFADVDGDQDQDILITGANDFFVFAKLYTNDGDGHFTEVLDTPFEGVYQSSIAFADVDGDQDQDVLITGAGPDGLVRASKLYTNNGQGLFAEVLDTPFESVQHSSVAFADVDGDQDQDVLIAGENESEFAVISKLYINDGDVSSTGYIVEDLVMEFILYPNPSATDNVYISLTSEENVSLTVTIFDVNGHLLRQQQERTGVGQQTFSIDISFWDKGTYIIQLDDGKRKGVHKFLVQ